MTCIVKALVIYELSWETDPKLNGGTSTLLHLVADLTVSACKDICFLGCLLHSWCLLSRSSSFVGFIGDTVTQYFVGIKWEEIKTIGAQGH